jgi:hypothetical protein
MGIGREGESGSGAKDGLNRIGVGLIRGRELRVPWKKLTHQRVNPLPKGGASRSELQAAKQKEGLEQGEGGGR